MKKVRDSYMGYGKADGSEDSYSILTDDEEVSDKDSVNFRQGLYFYEDNDTKRITMMKSVKGLFKIDIALPIIKVMCENETKYEKR